MKPKTARSTGKDASSGPSLYSFNRRDRHSDDISSILDKLEPARRKHAIWWRTGLVGLVVLLAAALYMVGSGVDVYRHLSPVGGEEMVVGRTVVQQEVQEPLHSAASVAEAESSAEQVVSESSLRHAELQASQPINLKTEEHADTVIVEAATENAMTSPVTVLEQKNIVLNIGIDEGQPKETAATTSRKKESKPVPRTRATAAVRAGKDSDVDLISVLASQNSRDEMSGKEIKKKHATETTEPRPVEAAVKRGGLADSNRDIVVRNEGESTEVLVKRCRALGLIEGELCRLRICSGLWGTDPACPGTAPVDQQSTSGR